MEHHSLSALGVTKISLKERSPPHVLRGIYVNDQDIMEEIGLLGSK
jgi:hypothetical protein